jgi:hypothetical protein
MHSIIVSVTIVYLKEAILVFNRNTVDSKIKGIGFSRQMPLLLDGIFNANGYFPHAPF